MVTQTRVRQQHKCSFLCERWLLFLRLALRETELETNPKPGHWSTAKLWVVQNDIGLFSSQTLRCDSSCILDWTVLDCYLRVIEEMGIPSWQRRPLRTNSDFIECGAASESSTKTARSMVSAPYFRSSRSFRSIPPFVGCPIRPTLQQHQFPQPPGDHILQSIGMGR